MTPHSGASYEADPNVSTAARGDWSALAISIGELARAGLPLPVSLRSAADQAIDPRQANTLDAIAKRLDDGAPLAEAVRDSDLPGRETLAATLETGSRSGDLYSVLATVARSEEVANSFRWRLRQALAYPLAVIALAVVLGATALQLMAMSFAQFADGMRYEPTPILSPVAVSLMAVPVVVVLVGLVEIVRTWRRGELPFAWWAPVRSVVNDLRFHRLVSHLQVLIEHDVPLPEALEIAGSAAGGKTQTHSREIAASLRSGRPFEDIFRSFHDTPPVVRALLSSLAAPAEEPTETRSKQRSLSERLHEASELLIESATARLDRFDQQRIFISAGLLGIGVLGFALMLYWPLVHSYWQVAQEPIGA